MYDVDAVRARFPDPRRGRCNGKPLVYLDNGASAQKPQAVIDAMTRAYAEEYANVHRGPALPVEPRDREVRGGARHHRALPRTRAAEDEIVFTTGTTEGINLVSYAWAAPRLRARRRDRAVGDGASRQHRALAFPARAAGRGAEMGRDRRRRRRSIPQAVIAAIGPRTRLVAVTHMSNVLGTVVDVEAICARRPGEGRAGAGRRQPGGGAHGGRRAGPRLRFLRHHRAQALRADRVGRDLCPPRAAGRDAPVPRRRRHDPRGPPRRGQLCRPADEVRGRARPASSRRSGSASRSTT